MISKAIKRLNREIRNIHDAAYLLAGFALFSTILALLRDKLLAYSFGAGVDLDIYYAAFRVPDLVYTVVASMVSVFILIPFLSNKESDKARQEFVHTLLFVFGALLFMVSFIMYLFTPFIMDRFFTEMVIRGYGEILIKMVHILLLQPIILGLSSIISSVVQYYGKYFIYALAPVLYNLGIIIGIVWLVPMFGIYGLAIGVVLGALMHVAIQLPSFYSLGFGKNFHITVLQDAVKVMAVSIPRTIALSANQVTLLMLIIMAGAMSEGSISVFNLAFNLQAAPLSIVAVSYSTAAFPVLSKLFANKDFDGFVKQIITASRHIIFWSLPIMALVIVLRAQIVRVIYGSGAFDWSDTRLTAAALALFVLSLVSQGLVLLLIRGYYASGRTIKPQILSILSAGMTIFFAIVLSKFYASSQYWRDFLEAITRTLDVGNTTVLMLPMAYSLSSIVTALLFFMLFMYDFKCNNLRAVIRTLLESLVGSFVIGITAYLVLQGITASGIVTINTLLEVFIQGALAGLIGVILGVVALVIIGNGEIRTVWRVLHHRVWKTKKVIADTELN